MARTIQQRIGRPSTGRYLELADKGRILNCDVTWQDILNAEDIFGQDQGSLKGKTVRKASSSSIRDTGTSPSCLSGQLSTYLPMCRHHEGKQDAILDYDESCNQIWDCGLA